MITSYDVIYCRLCSHCNCRNLFYVRNRLYLYFEWFLGILQVNSLRHTCNIVLASGKFKFGCLIIFTGFIKMPA